MHDSEETCSSPACRVALREVQQTLEQLDALQSLELQHLQLRIHRANQTAPLSVDSIAPRAPDCVVSPRRAA